MEAQQQEEQQEHRGTGGSDGRGGARAAAQGPHHGGRLTRSGAPPAGNPGRPRRGVAATTSAVATPASSLAAAPSQEVRGGRGGVRRGEKEGGLQRAPGERLLPPRSGEQRGPASQARAGGRAAAKPEHRRRCPQRCGEEEAELRSAGAGAGVPKPGSGRRRRRGPTGAHPTISRPAAGTRSAPGSERGGPQERAPPGAGPRGGGFLQTRSSRDGSGGGRGGGGERVRRGQAADRPRPGRRRAGAPAGGRVPRSSWRARRAAAGPQAAGVQQPLGGPTPHLRTPAGGEPRGGRRKRSRRPLLPPSPLPEPGAPAGGGEVVPGDFSRPLASPGEQSERGLGVGRAGRPSCEGVWGGGPRAAAPERITATRSRVQHSKFQESSPLLPSFPKSEGGGGIRQAPSSVCVRALQTLGTPRKGAGV